MKKHYQYFYYGVLQSKTFFCDPPQIYTTEGRNLAADTRKLFTAFWRESSLQSKDDNKVVFRKISERGFEMDSCPKGKKKISAFWQKSCYNNTIA